MARVVPIGLARMTTGAPSGPSIEETRRTSDIEEDCLALTLQEDVESELALGLGHRDEGGRPLRRADVAVSGRQRPCVERDDAERAVRRGRAAAEAAEALVSAGGGAARVVGV